MPELTVGPRLDKLPPVVVHLRRPVTRLALVGLFTALLALVGDSEWRQTGAFLLLLTLFPASRRLLLVLAAVSWALWLDPPLSSGLLDQFAPERGAAAWSWTWPGAVVAVWLLGGAFLWLVRCFPSSLPARWPVCVLFLLLVLLLLTAVHAPLRGLPWFLVAACAVALGHYLWFFAYAVGAARTRPAVTWLTQLGYWRPFWGFSNVPFGKGAAYLERFEARDDTQLARVQLKGLKLLVWAVLLCLVRFVLSRVLYGPEPLASWSPLLPTYGKALASHSAGSPYPWGMRWLALIGQFLMNVLHLTISGHLIIATCRMAGFDVLPNTYRPLTATTIAEFYNRLYYYFKELLVTFFFYPTYLRCFKGWPRLRTFTATVAAAGFGNFVFHFLRDDHSIFELGFGEALLASHVYAVYALILGVAIGLSQLRTMTRSRTPLAGWRKGRAIVGVLTFYCLLTLIDNPAPSYTLADYGSYFLSLFRP